MRWHVLKSEIVYRAGIFDLRRDSERAESSGRVHDFHVLEVRDWVTVVPITADAQVVLVRQFRHGIRGLTLEVPAGFVDSADVSVAATAQRELREETGYECEALRPLGSVHPNPAIFNNRCHIFRADNAYLAGPPQWDDTEEIEIELAPLTQIPSLIRTGVISNALTVVAFHFLDLVPSPVDR